jgi:methionyl-tRNA formyltransferase
VPTPIERPQRAVRDRGGLYARGEAGGRGTDLQRTPIDRDARHLALAVRTPKTLKDDVEQKIFHAHNADAAVVVAYGLILPKPILEAPRLGCFNVHASLLPRWRGAAPINRAIMAGDAESGVTIMKMDEGLDTGAMATAERAAIGADMTAGELHDALSRVGADLMQRVLVAAESAVSHTANGEETLAEKFPKTRRGSISKP